MRLGVCLVGKLIDVVAAGNALRQPLGHVGVVFRMAMRHVRTRQTNIRPHRSEMLYLFLGHLVRNDQQHLVAARPPDQRQRQPGVAGRRLHDRAARLQEALALGRLDHLHGDAVLDRPARVLRLQLQQQATSSGVDPLDLHHRRLADQIKRRRNRRAEGWGGQGHAKLHAGSSPKAEGPAPSGQPASGMTATHARSAAGEHQSEWLYFWP